MSRLKPRKPNRFEDGARQSIGDYYVNEACARLDVACATEAALFVQSFISADLVPVMFNDDAIVRLKAVHKLLNYEQDTANYNIAEYGVAVWLRFSHMMPAPGPAAMEWHDERADVFTAALRQLIELHEKWGAVKYLLRWFNRHATPGAVRAIWPSVLQLCPDAPALKDLQHAPVRYTNPQGLAQMLPLIRTTASTAATMAMIPGDAKPRIRSSVWVTVPERGATYEGIEIRLNSQQFNL